MRDLLNPIARRVGDLLGVRAVERDAHTIRLEPPGHTTRYWKSFPVETIRNH